MKKKSFAVSPLIIIIIAIGCLFFLYSCYGDIFPKQDKPLKGIILISLDTLRADHLSCYGYHRNTSPFIDTFAKENVVFENAVAQAPWTLPSHMSIMTSLYPSFHGLARKFPPPLADEHKTLAELLQERGYQTAAFTDGAWVSPVFGFGQGFDSYDNQGGGIAVILPKVKKWLDENRSKPFFLFIHCFDIHSPYNPPSPYNSIFHDSTYTGFLVPNTKNLVAAMENRLAINDEDLRHFIALYDGGIRYTDAHIGDLLTYLRESKLYDQTLIALTSDHGEEFKEHDSMGHWQLYHRPDLNVPLIMHIPNYPKKEIRIAELVRSIDLLPTLLDVVRVPPYPQAQGRSLLPLIKRHKSFLQYSLWRIVNPFTEDVYFSFAETVPNNSETSYWSVMTSDGYQMLFDSQSPTRRLFSLTTDPLGQKNIAQDHADHVERLSSEWKTLYATKPTYASSSAALDEQTMSQLKALGYLETPEQIPVEISAESFDDPDKDGKKGLWDNCPNNANPHQKDIDKDEVGDICDNCIDADWDGYGNPDYPNKCEDDNCPTIFNPRQEDADGDGIGDACEPPPWMKNHWLEAEYADTIIKPLEVATNENASEGKYIYAPNGTGDQYTPGPIMATYKVRIAQAGEYILWGRISVSDKKDNSFFVQVVGGENNVWEVETGNNWHWDMLNNLAMADPVISVLKEGLHTIKVKLREDGAKLDKMVLTNYRGFVPKGTGDIAENTGSTGTADPLNRCRIFWSGESATTYGEKRKHPVLGLARDRKHSVLGLAVRNPPLGYTIEPWIDDDMYSLSYGGRTVNYWNIDYGSCDLYNDAGSETYFDCFSYYDAQCVIIQLGVNHISRLAQDHEGDVDIAVSDTIAFVQRIQALGKKVIWITIHPMDKDGLKNGKPYENPELLPEGTGDFGEGKTECTADMETVDCSKYWNSNHEYFIDRFKPWCEANDVGFIDVFQHIRNTYGDDTTDDFVEAYSVDGMHIKYPGSEIIYTYIRSQLKTMLLFDADNDGVSDCIDNCPDTANADQTETDGDCMGDVCDAFPHEYDPAQPDSDTDGIGDTCDNCSETANGPNLGTCYPWPGMAEGTTCMNDLDCAGSPGSCRMNQEDGDADDVGDVCDNCPDDYNPNQEDGDADDVGDVCDNCPGVPNPDQKDTYPPQGNNTGDACDCEGDFNCDGSVNAADSTLFLIDFNIRTKLKNPCTAESQCNGDFDCDGDVDENDKTIFQTDFGRGKYKNPCPACKVRDWCAYE